MTTPDAPEHLRTWEALPWVANGRATPAQQALVNAHLPHCAGCREELAWQRRLCQAAQPGTAGDDEAAEPALQALLARLDDAPPEQAPAALPARGGPRRLTQALAAAVLVQAVGLGALGWQLGQAGRDEGYRTLGSGPAAPPTATLRVLPDPALPLADWHALLHAHGLQPVGGPNSAGAYALAPAPAGLAAPPTPGPSAVPPSEAASGAALPLAQVLAALRAHPGVRLAEPIAP